MQLSVSIVEVREVDFLPEKARRCGDPQKSNILLNFSHNHFHQHNTNFLILHGDQVIVILSKSACLEVRDESPRPDPVIPFHRVPPKKT